MRVIAGQFRSRKLKPVPGNNVRPTPDRLREALFNVLQTQIAGTIFLDAYAGTGAVGIEALSRGSQHAVLIEKRADAIAIIRDNVRSLGIEALVTVVRGAAAAVLRNYPCNIAFVDPPYELLNEYAGSLEALSSTQCRLAILQHLSKLNFDETVGAFRKIRVLRQGDNSLSFYERA